MINSGLHFPKLFVKRFHLQELIYFWKLVVLDQEPRLKHSYVVPMKSPVGTPDSLLLRNNTM